MGCHVYDALIRNRVFKDPMPHSDATALIAQALVQHDDPDVVDAFVAIHGDCKAIVHSYRDH